MTSYYNDLHDRDAFGIAVVIIVVIILGALL